MRRAELDRLRELLRETDPAADVDGPPPEQWARLRRTVLAAVPEPRGSRVAWIDTLSWPGARRWALAACAVALLAAGATALLRLLDGAPEGVAAERTPVQAPSAPALPSAQPPALDGAAAPTSATSPPEPRIAARATRPTRREPAAAAPRPQLVAAEPAEPEPPAAAPTAIASGGDATAEGVAIAALPAPLGRQIQVTAPGGTRIVWILTPSTGP